MDPKETNKKKTEEKDIQEKNIEQGTSEETSESLNNKEKERESEMDDINNLPPDNLEDSAIF